MCVSGLRGVNCTGLVLDIIFYDSEVRNEIEEWRKMKKNRVVSLISRRRRVILKGQTQNYGPVTRVKED